MSENIGDSSSNAVVVISNEYTSTPIGLTKSASSEISGANETPRIICNELIINPHKSKSIEKLDELSSLEREIAKMHHVDDINLDEGITSSTSTNVENLPDHAQITALPSNTSSDLSNGQSNIPKCQDSRLEDKLDAITSGETALEHEDLIAVLKGLDGTTDESHNNSASGNSNLEEGVTIEGEGEYQIMEVVYEDSNATEEVTKPDDNVAHTLNKTKTFGATTLTAQEERALALEQIECLKSATKQHRRRKQDIKPIKQMDSALDLVSALEADWSENDEETNEKQKAETKTKPKLSTTSAKITTKATGDNKTNSPLITSVVVIPSLVTTTSTTTVPTTTLSKSTTNTIPDSVNTSKNEDNISSNSSPIDGVIETKTEEGSQVLSSQTGFRRTRIIKRKIIWDPDAPETTFSYAKLVRSNNNSKAKNDTIPIATITKGSTTITPLNKKESTAISASMSTKKPQLPITKDKKSAADLNTEKTSSTKPDSSLPKATVEKDTVKSNNKMEETVTKTANTSLETKTTETSPSPTSKSLGNSPAKRRSQTPVSNGSGGAGIKKKKITEVDRLMGDEGAVNMLNSLEKLEATLGSSEIKSTRPMMRSRAATICEKLPRKETTSPTRTTPPATTNQQTSKGKRTPKSRASSTWDYVYKKKKQDFDDSLIIRRRSNSSYSSTASLNRLSLDGPPASIANTNNSSTKSIDSKTSPASISGNDSSKSLPSTSSHNKSASSSKNSSTPPLGKSFEFAKPESKKSQKRTKSPSTTLTNDMKKAAPVTSRRNARSPATTNEDKDVKTSTKIPTTSKEKKDLTLLPTTISDVVVKKSSKVAQILFSTNKAKLSNTFTIQMLNKLVDILDKLASDPDCHVIVIGTNDNHFCQGIDITDLTTIATEKRKNYAVNLATSVKNYLKTLATYPKPLVAGVNGNLMNLGVIQLALFDIVISSDKSTFETPYTKMGQVPEGYCIWHNMNKIRGSFKTKLFWLCEKIQSTEAALAGLVNKLTAANKVNDEALNTAKRIASLSVESYYVMKKTVINSHLDVIVSSLDEEFDTIIKQWTSGECLEKMKKYLEHGHF